jgi:hypothetical protein
VSFFTNIPTSQTPSYKSGMFSIGIRLLDFQRFLIRG